MKRLSRIYFNPVTKEIEIEGSEEFIRTYFDKLQKMLPGSPEEVKAESKVAKAHPMKRINIKKAAKAEISAPRKVIKAAEGKIRDRKGKTTLIDTVMGLIKGSPTGITASELREKTGFTPKRIESITYRAAKLGKIKRPKPGTYEAAV